LFGSTHIYVNEVIDYPLMLALIVKSTLSAIRLAVKWDGRKRDQNIIDDQYDPGRTRTTNLRSGDSAKIVYARETCAL